jgi:hypothetical protein
VKSSVSQDTSRRGATSWKELDSSESNPVFAHGNFGTCEEERMFGMEEFTIGS